MNDKKMQGMVEIFIYKITWQAIENTPYGSVEDYVELYNRPSRLKYLPAEAGYAKGGWVMEMNKPFSSMFFTKADSENALNTKYFNESRSLNYKLGDTVYITNNVPYVANDGWSFGTYKNGNPVKSLESGASSQAPNGIMQPTLNEILNIYQFKLDEFYKAS